MAERDLSSELRHRHQQRKAATTILVVLLMLFFAFWYAYSYYKASGASGEATPTGTETWTSLPRRAIQTQFPRSSIQATELSAPASKLREGPPRRLWAMLMGTETST